MQWHTTTHKVQGKCAFMVPTYHIFQFVHNEHCLMDEKWNSVLEMSEIRKYISDNKLSNVKRETLNIRKWYVWNYLRSLWSVISRFKSLFVQILKVNTSKFLISWVDQLSFLFFPRHSLSFENQEKPKHWQKSQILLLHIHAKSGTTVSSAEKMWFQNKQLLFLFFLRNHKTSRIWKILGNHGGFRTNGWRNDLVVWSKFCKTQRWRFSSWKSRRYQFRAKRNNGTNQRGWIW